MSDYNGQTAYEDAGTVTVEDEEGDVDKQLKNRVIKARNRVDETETALFVNAELEPGIDMPHAKKLHSWGTIIRQFLRTIEPLLEDNDIEGATEFYEQVRIGEIVLSPPAIDGYDFEMAAQMDMSDKEIRKALDLPMGATIPKPEVREFYGLKSIIEAEQVIEKQWTVKVSAEGPPTEHEYVTVRAREPLSKQLYEETLRNADRFLQRAGIAIETSASDYMGGGEPGL